MKEWSSHTPGHELSAQLQRLDRRRYAVEHQATLSSADLRLLWLLSDNTGRTLREIAEALDLEQSTVNRQVNRAIQGGYLERSTHSGGAAAVVTPTQQGERKFQRDVALVLQLYNDALESLGDDADEFVRLTQRFVQAYDNAVQRTLNR